MQLHSLGSTGLLVSTIGLGLAALSRPGYITLGHADDLAHEYNVDAMKKHAFLVLDAAWDAGVRYFDAARSYGRGEEFLGGWLHSRAVAPGSVTVGSKWGYTYTANWQVQADKHEIKEHSLPVLRRQWQESQTNLDCYLSLYQIHSATLESRVLDNSAVLSELVQLKERGVAIGLSLSGPQQAQTLEVAAACTVACTVDGRRVFDAVQATWNLLEPSAGTGLAAAQKAGMGVIVKEALANGRLTQRNHDPAFGAQRNRLMQEAERLGCTIDALSLAAALTQPWADVVLSGAATVAQLQSNLAALNVAWDGETTETLASLTETPDHYWRTRAALAWN